MERLTKTNWRNLDPWECCGQDDYCKRGCHDEGGCTKGCIVPKLYDLLAAYEDIGMEPEEIQALISPTNAPLTLWELREMEWEPVWTKRDMFPDDCGFRVIRRVGKFSVVFTDMRRFPIESYGKTWLAYRRKPEEENND